MHTGGSSIEYELLLVSKAQTAVFGGSESAGLFHLGRFED
jgi:hypothetical protein